MTNVQTEMVDALLFNNDMVKYPAGIKKQGSLDRVFTASLPRHQKKERWGTNKDNTNATVKPQINKE